MDNALCGGAGATLSGNALAAVKVAIFMGDPHNVAGLSYNVGTCTAGGVSNAIFRSLPHSTLHLVQKLL
jgi:acetylxylan esterase